MAVGARAFMQFRLASGWYARRGGGGLGTLARWAEAALVLVLIIQLARLVWAIATPVGMFGSWDSQRPQMLGSAQRDALFSAFDPFYRTAPAGDASAQVTSLSLTLFGTRINEASGQGSAIIATPDGVQSSFAVGDEVMPGVLLKAVAFDHVVLNRGGAEETLFLDQSDGGSSEADAASPPSATGDTPSASSGALTPAMVTEGVAFAPRVDGGRITGIVVSPKNAGDAFAKAGFQPGDIVTQVNGRPITSSGDIQGLQSQLRPGARLSLMVERGAATVPIAIMMSGER